MKRFILFFLLFIASCSTLPVAPVTTSYKQSAKELKDIIKVDKTLSPVAKIVIKHAINDLENADKLQKDAENLEKKVISDSKEAGAGKLVYTLIYGGIGVFVLLVVLKIMKKLPF